MFNINQRAVETVKETFKSLGYDIDSLPSLTVEFDEMSARLTIIVGEYASGSLRRGISEVKKFNYCALNKEGTAVAEIRFTIICEILDSVRKAYENSLDDIVYSLQAVMKEYFDKEYKNSRIFKIVKSRRSVVVEHKE